MGNKERQAAYAARQREKGLVKLCLWVYEKDVSLVRGFARKLAAVSRYDREDRYGH
jgi:hypothetical protein